MPGFLQNALGTANLFTPYAGVNPMGTLSFNNGAFNQSFSPQQQGLNTLFGNQITSNMTSGAMGYNPNTSFLPSQFTNFSNNLPSLPSLNGLASVAGSTPNLTQYGNVGTVGNAFNTAATGLLNANSNFGSNVDNLFNSQVAAQAPYIQNFLQSNRDNEFAKGTLASTAGGYQTMGADQAVLNNLNQMRGQAFNQALGLYGTNLNAAQGLGATGSGLNLQQAGLLGNLANTQFGNQLTAQQALYGAGLQGAGLGLGEQQALFGAANQTAQLGEAQSEFGPQFTQGQTQGLFSNILGQNNMLTNQLGLGLQAGYQQGMINKTPSTQQQATAGLLNGLLFGNGSGGLINSLFGISAGSNGQGTALGALGSLASKGIGYLFGNNGMSQQDINNMTGLNYNPDGSFNYTGGGAYNSSDLTNEGISPGVDSSTPYAGDQGMDQLTSGQDYSDWYNSLNFNGAGGQAAAQTQPQGGAALPGMMSAAGPAANAALALAQGNYLGAAPSLTSAAARAGLASGVLSKDAAQELNSGAGYLGGALGVYQGIKQGGVAGDTEAAASAARLATNAGFLGGSGGAVASVAGKIAAPLALYSAVSNWKSGATLSDAANGASAGAAIGSIIPGIGTAIGAIVGGAIGALSSAFGGGEADPETENVESLAPQYEQNHSIINQLSPAQDFQVLAGVMDAKNNSPGHSQAMEQVFGREGEGGLVNQMTTRINMAINSGEIRSTATPDQIYSQVVAPWLKTKGASIDPSSYIDAKGDKDNGMLEGVLTNLIGAWQQGKLTSSTPVGVTGQKVNIPAYGQSPDFGKTPMMTSNNFTPYGANVPPDILQMMNAYAV